MSDTPPTRNEIEAALNNPAAYLGGVDSIVRERDSLRSQLDAAREALKTFGMHKAECDYIPGVWPACTCGLAASIAATEEGTNL